MSERGRFAVWLGRAAVVLGGLVVAIGFCELAVRAREGQPLLPLVPPEPYIDNAVLYQPSPNRLYELRPGVDAIVGRSRVHIRVNAAGQRDDRVLPMEKPAGLYRVVVLGDSFTFGGKVAVENAFPRRLEIDLGASDRSRRYEVVNLAVPGYNTRQEMLSLRESGLAYHPDLVVVNFVLNDVGPAVQLIPHESRWPLGLRRVLKRSDLVQFLYVFAKRKRLERAGLLFRDGEKYSELAAGSPLWEDARAALVEIHRLAAQAGAQTLVVVWPMLYGLDRDYPYRKKHALVVAACNENGIRVLDLLPTFEGQDASALWVAPNDHHPNAIALEMAASAVVRELSESRSR